MARMYTRLAAMPKKSWNMCIIFIRELLVWYMLWKMLALINLFSWLEKIGKSRHTLFSMYTDIISLCTANRKLPVYTYNVKLNQVTRKWWFGSFALLWILLLKDKMLCNLIWLIRNYAALWFVNNRVFFSSTPKVLFIGGIYQTSHWLVSPSVESFDVQFQFEQLAEKLQKSLL